MRIYVASASEDLTRARNAMKILQGLGHEITHDWTDAVEEFGSGGGDRYGHALVDLKGVRDADVVLLLTPFDKSIGCGMWIELGAALGLGKRVVVTGPLRNRSIFCDLTERHEHDLMGIEAVHEKSRAIEERASA